MGSHWKDFKKVNHMTYLCILGVTLRINCHGITLPTSLLFQNQCMLVVGLFIHIYIQIRAGDLDLRRVKYLTDQLERRWPVMVIEIKVLALEQERT